MIKAINMTKIKHIGKHEIFKYKGINFIGEDFGNDLKKNLVDIKQEKNTPNILLSHIPIFRPDELSKYNIFLFLGGHTHGGQLFPLHLIVYFANVCKLALFCCDALHALLVGGDALGGLLPAFLQFFQSIVACCHCGFLHS